MNERIKNIINVVYRFLRKYFFRKRDSVAPLTALNYTSVTITRENFAGRGNESKIDAGSWKGGKARKRVYAKRNG